MLVSSIVIIYVFLFVINEYVVFICFFFFQAEDGIRDGTVTGVQTCALPIYEPLPNYRSLMVRAKYRYVLSFETRDFMAVSQHVRHFADLLRTQGLMVSEMSAAALYHADAEARFAAANLGLDVSKWAIPDATKRKSWTQMTAAGLFFTLPGVSEATVRKALACMDSPCSAIVDGIGLGRSFVAYGGEENLNMLTNLATSRNCESEVIDRASQMPAVSSSDALMVMTSGLPKFFASQ